MSKPKILFWDIETAGVNALKSDLGFCLMVGYKWAGSKKVKVLTIKKRDLRKFNDEPLLRAFSKVYKEADITVAHFGSVFDRRFFQGRLLINRLPPIPPTKMRDTCMIARSVANYSSNRLVALGNTLTLNNRKMEKGDGWPNWWFRAMRGDMQAIRDMAAYCRDDVLALEELYYRLLPFDNAHPRMHENRMKCPKDGSTGQYHGRQWHNGKPYRRFQCNACGGWYMDGRIARKAA